ncbi:flagellar M-ring protein FliF [Halorhodospira abdelmalekii]|uniref:flagellar basal-body MS-ring/collar protein FliF n=1 Tax=Halorhodospira abdelmalekii TaxID=421629 RepID=UPI001902E483|nr:flagellar basal-body MS-ring/collar protein FliF [Halorhodospira abdelmalekii]MBK1734852.1 flagellar M-ring protein FliF [Halorhodospira abdelmalekii]
MAESRAMAEADGAMPPSPVENGSGQDAGGRDSSGLGRYLPEDWQAQLEAWLGENPLRKIALGVGLLAIVGLGVALFIWAQGPPELRTLYADLDSEDAAQVINVLEERGVRVEFDERTGDIRVPAEHVHRARIFLAAEGLPRGTTGFGYEMLSEDPGFGVSEFMEHTRFDRALETELARSIQSLRAVRSARVHLDVPQQSVFVRDRREAKASVILELSEERQLPRQQVDAIVHLVASAVSDLSHQNVSIVDHRGRLLTADERPTEATAAAQQHELTRQVEERIERRVEDLLEPLIGPGRVRTQVSARLNFDTRRHLEEFFDPERSAIRSEQMSERSGGGYQWPIGIPGALTNQPPGPGALDPDNDRAGGWGTPFSADETRNWEVGRSLVEAQPALGVLDRLTVGVLIDHRYVENEEGQVVREALSDAEITRLEALVRDAVGFDQQRGDAVSVVTVPFAEIVSPPDPPPEVWEQEWVRDLIRLAVFAAIGLLIYIIAIRPIVNRVLGGVEPEESEGEAAEREQAALASPLGEGEQESEATLRLAGLGGEQLSDMRERPYEAKLQAVLELIENEPELAANAVKQWLDEDDR